MPQYLQATLLPPSRMIKTLLGGALIALPTFAFADACPDVDSPAVRSVQFIFENDVLGGNTDRYYTNGWQLGVTMDSRKAPEYAHHLIDWIQNKDSRATPDCGERAATRAVSYTLGQLMFTPQDITIAEPQPNDRPWAGWLYVGMAIKDQGIVGSYRLQQTYGLDLGVTGPASFADQTQAYVHEHISKDSPEPMGWDNQIKTEFGVVLKYKIEGRKETENPAWFDLTPEAGFTVGNILTNVSAGGTARLGLLDCKFRGYDNHIEPSIEFPESYNGSRSKQCSPDSIGIFREVYLFAGARGRGVVRNIFLDGNTFKDSASVDSKPFVYDLYWGIYARLSDWMGSLDGTYINFTMTRRSPEFSTPAGDASVQRFGSIVVGMEF